jgi:hypothetical protein
MCVACHPPRCRPPREIITWSRSSSRKTQSDAATMVSWLANNVGHHGPRSQRPLDPRRAFATSVRPLACSTERARYASSCSRPASPLPALVNNTGRQCGRSHAAGSTLLFEPISGAAAGRPWLPHEPSVSSWRGRGRCHDDFERRCKSTSSSERTCFSTFAKKRRDNDHGRARSG